LKRCLYCFDKFNVLADIAFGDCYIGGKRNKQGLSNIIVRTSKGASFLEKCGVDLKLVPELPNVILESQQSSAKAACFWAGEKIHTHRKAVKVPSPEGSQAGEIEAVHKNVVLLDAVRSNPQLIYRLLRRAQWRRMLLLYRPVLSKARLLRGENK
jgi:hypothetical protein